MKKIILLFVLLLGFLFFAKNGIAYSIIGGPGLPGFGYDDYTELFTPLTEIVVLELYDLLGDASFPTTFGFYFASDPSNLIPIFGDEDDPTIPGSEQTAQVDFSSGVVSDLDAGGITQSSFTPGISNIGFFQLLDLSSIGVGPILLYSQASLNAGVDAVATFPSLTDDDKYLIGFEIYNPDPAVSDYVTLSLEITDGIKPVPEPSTLFLLFGGIGIIAFFMKKNNFG